jgi:hypothetical protein
MSFEAGTSPTITITVKAKPTKLTLTVDKTTVYLGETITFSGQLIDAVTNVGINGKTVSLYSDTTKVADTTTKDMYGLTGWYGFSVSMQKVGTFTFQTKFAGGSSPVEYAPSESPKIGVTIGEAPPNKLTLTEPAWGTRVSKGATVIFRGGLYADSTPVSGKTIWIQYKRRDGVWVNLASGSTGADGSYTISITASIPSDAWTVIHDVTYRAWLDGTTLTSTETVIYVIVPEPNRLTLTEPSWGTRVSEGATILFKGGLYIDTTPVPNRTIQIQYKRRDGVWVNLVSGLTGADGAYAISTSATIPADAWTVARDVTYRAWLDGTTLTSGETVVYIIVTATTLTIKIFDWTGLTEKTQFTTSEKAKIIGALSAGGALLSGKAVKLIINGQEVASTTTGGYGNYSFDTTFAAEGTHQVYVKFGGDGTYQACTSPTVTVTVTVGYEELVFTASFSSSLAGFINLEGLFNEVKSRIDALGLGVLVNYVKLDGGGKDLIISLNCPIHSPGFDLRIIPAILVVIMAILLTILTGGAAWVTIPIAVGLVAFAYYSAQTGNVPTSIPQYKLTITVADEAGYVLKDAKVDVSLTGVAVGSQTTPETGKVEFTLKVGTYHVVATKTGYQTAAEDIAIKDADVSKIITLKASPAGTADLTVNVKTAKQPSTPIIGASVQVDTNVGVTDASGNAVFTNLAFKTYTITVSATGYQTQSLPYNFTQTATAYVLLVEEGQPSRFTCPYCAETFDSQLALNAHIMFKHFCKPLIWDTTTIPCWVAWTAIASPFVIAGTAVAVKKMRKKKGE